MKYAMVIVRAEDEWKPVTEAQHEFDALVRWWAGLRAQGKILTSVALATSQAAHTVSWNGETPVITDGPYIEAKETVGGLVVLDVESEAEALAIASSWPNKVGIRIEVRPTLER